MEVNIKTLHFNDAYNDLQPLDDKKGFDVITAAFDFLHSFSPEC